SRAAKSGKRRCASCWNGWRGRRWRRATCCWIARSCSGNRAGGNPGTDGTFPGFRRPGGQKERFPFLEDPGDRRNVSRFCKENRRETRGGNPGKPGGKPGDRRNVSRFY